MLVEGQKQGIDWRSIGNTGKSVLNLGQETGLKGQLWTQAAVFSI